MKPRTPSPTALGILTLTRVRARRLTLWMEHLWQAGLTSPDQGPAIGSGEVARLLTADAMSETELAFYAERAPELSAQIVAAAAELAADDGWTQLHRSFGLTPDESDLLSLALAVEIDPGLERVLAYLHDDVRLTHPTPWLAAKLSGRALTPFSGTNLRRWLLAAPHADASAQRPLSPWQVDPALAHAVFNWSWHDSSIANFTTRVDPEVPRSLPCLHPAAAKSLRELPDPREVELVGVAGIGKQMLAAQYAAESGQALLVVELQDLVDSGMPAGNALTRVLRQAKMTGAFVYVRNAESATESDWERARSMCVPYLRGVRHPTGRSLPLTVAPLPIDARLRLWGSAATEPPPEWLITQRLTPAEILRAAALPAAVARLALRQRASRPDHALLTRLPTLYAWDDLILPPEVFSQLRAFASQIRLRWRVYEQWGFARLTHLGQGISALFGGPSGTGKTLAAQVLAHELELELLRVDLAGVVNKYIGETEKKLREVFDACEDSGALLFFDEADALFGNRTQVKDAHDRFANIEIDYLLQRLERFDGVAILATNRRQDLDPAFVRRLRFVVEFTAPRPSERLVLWQRSLPPTAPNGDVIRDEIDWTYLSERLPMNGAEIKSAVLSAAFLAHEEGTRIGMRHVLLAAQREMAKQGQRMRIASTQANL